VADKYGDACILGSLEDFLTFEPREGDCIVVDESNQGASLYKEAFVSQIKTILQHHCNHRQLYFFYLAQQCLKTPLYPLLRLTQALTLWSDSEESMAMLRHLPMVSRTQERVRNVLEYLDARFLVIHLNPAYKNRGFKTCLLSYLQQLPEWCMLFRTTETKEVMLKALQESLPSGQDAPDNAYILIRPDELPSSVTEGASSLGSVDQRVMSMLRDMAAPKQYRKLVSLWTMVKKVGALCINPEGTQLMIPNNMTQRVNLFTFFREALMPTGLKGTRPARYPPGLLQVTRALLVNDNFPAHLIPNTRLKKAALALDRAQGRKRR